MPRRWHHVLKKITLLRGNGGKKARSPGRARSKPLKPFAQGRPGHSGEPVVTNSYAFYLWHTRLRVHQAPGFPCALSSRARMIKARAGDVARARLLVSRHSGA